MSELARKDRLGKNLQRMRRAFPADYDFFPATFTLPADYAELRAQFKKKTKKTWIVKPDASSQGRGIYLTRSLDDIDAMGGEFIVQEYVTKVDTALGPVLNICSLCCLMIPSSTYVFMC